jgi:hypothetical protein
MTAAYGEVAAAKWTFRHYIRCSLDLMLAGIDIPNTRATDLVTIGKVAFKFG